MQQLEQGLDFRKKEYRRDVFLKFYEFHLKYKAHPGCVYYMFPYLISKFNLTKEQSLWLAYINGCSQNIITSWLIFEQMPTVNSDLQTFEKWFREHYDKLGWDTDRRYIKNSFIKCIANYKYILNGRTNEQFFEEQCTSDSDYQNFKDIWKLVINHFFLFGRLATFSYLEYLKIVGLPIDCHSLFIDDISGSKSHRNGLCKVLGRDDLDWHSSNPSFDGKYSPLLLKWLDTEGEFLLQDAEGQINHPDVNYFTLESTLCCYKSMFREKRRYPNVYNDMFFKRIKYAEQKWNRDFPLFWSARKKYLPKYLCVEDNLADPTHDQVGLSIEKQNLFRLTGQIPMLNYEYSCFKNDFNDKYYSNGIERFMQ